MAEWLDRSIQSEHKMTFLHRLRHIVDESNSPIVSKLRAIWDDIDSANEAESLIGALTI